MSRRIILFAFLSVLCLIFTVSSALPTSQNRVQVPSDCAQACPHHDGNLLCARNKVTGQLGTFESDCVLGRYNSCIRTTQQYEFVNYGEC